MKKRILTLLTIMSAVLFLASCDEFPMPGGDEVVLEETPVVLPLPEEVEPVKVLKVSVIVPEELEEEEENFVPEQLTVAIPMEEEEITELEGMKLVLVLADGTLVEIPYEIVEGKLVFTTTQIGVFALIPVEE